MIKEKKPIPENSKIFAALIESSGFRNEHLAGKFGVSKQYFSHWATGYRTPPEEIIETMRRVVKTKQKAFRRIFPQKQSAKSGEKSEQA